MNNLHSRRNHQDGYLLRPISKNELIQARSECDIFDFEISQSICLLNRADEQAFHCASIGKDNIVREACWPSDSSWHHLFTDLDDNLACELSYLVRLPSALICPPCCFVVSGLTRYWPDSRFNVNWKQGLPYGRKLNKKIFIDKLSIDLELHIKPVILVGGTKNYYHWHIDKLPVLYSLRDRINSGDYAVIVSDLTAWQRSGLEMLGIDMRNLLEVSNKPIYCASLIYSSYLAAKKHRQPKITAAIYADLRHLVSATNYHSASLSSDAPELIFISRQDASKRKLINEDEIYSALSEMGFIRLVPGRLSYAEQIHAFSRAKLIVAQHGAGLVNMGFAPAGCKIVEILCDTYINTCFWRLSQICNHNYAYILASPGQRVSVSRHGHSFLAPVSAVVNAARIMLKSI